jgi:RNA polymerase sigma factor (sigma-70 family)
MSTNIKVDFDESIRQILEDLQQKEPIEDLKFVNQVLRKNILSGRLRKVLVNYQLGLEDYVASVVDNVRKYRTYLHELRIEKSDGAWLNLQGKLQEWSYNLFVSWGAFLEYERPDQAYEASVDGILEILKTKYPYDVDFESWAYSLQRNVCRHHVRNASNRANGFNNKLLEIDADDWYEEILPDTKLVPLETDLSKDEESRALLTSITALRQDQQNFVQHYYFDHLSYADISSLMDRKKEALYSLHFDTLRSLRVLMIVEP